MKLHRFYVGGTSLDDKLQVDEKTLLWQWNKVLRLNTGSRLVLFNEAKQEAEFEINQISTKIASLNKRNDIEPHLPGKDIWLFWSLVKRDNNEIVLQKCTELGVSHFVPIISTRTIKKDFNLERAKKIIVEASEQCGRSDTPSISGPVKLEQAIKDYASTKELLVADQFGELQSTNYKLLSPIGVLVGPEGGWTDAEHELFRKNNLKKMNIGQFTLRAETAAIVAAAKLL